MKPATMYFSAAIPHPEIPGGFWSKFSIIGAVPEWVMDHGGGRRVFATAEEAEISGYRAMMMRLNRSKVVQIPVVRGQPVAEARRTRMSQTQSEVSRIFARFKKPGNDSA